MRFLSVSVVWTVSVRFILVLGGHRATKRRTSSNFGRLCVKIMIPSSIEQLILEYKYSMERHELHKRMLADFRDTWFSLIFRRFCRRVIAFLEL